MDPIHNGTLYLSTTALEGRIVVIISLIKEKT